MTIHEPRQPTLWPGKRISSDEDDKRLDRALQDMIEDQWINDFVKRLNYTIEDIVRKN